MRSKQKFIRDIEDGEKKALNMWITSKETIYSENDLEAFVNENVSICTEYCFHDWLYGVVKAIRKRYKKRGFCIVNNKIYCNEYGYQKLIEHFKGHGMLKVAV